MLGGLAAATLLSFGFAALPANQDASQDTNQDAAAPTRAERDFERIKALAGEWEALAEDGSVVPDSDWSFRVSAGGSVVLETLFVGSAHEMLTVYLLEDGELVLTHYCALGNQPHMHAQEDSPEGTLRFEATHVANRGEESNMAMTKAKLTFNEDGTISTLYSAYAGDELGGEVGFHLRRKAGGTR